MTKQHCKPTTSIDQDNIIPFPTPKKFKKELTYTETYDAVWDTIDVLESFYQEKKSFSPAEVCKAVIETRIAEKYEGRQV